MINHNNYNNCGNVPVGSISCSSSWGPSQAPTGFGKAEISQKQRNGVWHYEKLVFERGNNSRNDASMIVHNNNKKKI
jgi:hypothetical protein